MTLVHQSELRSVEFDGPPGATNKISVADERERVAGDGVVASITLEGDESSWGEFLTLADAAVLHAWLGVLVADPDSYRLP